MTVYPFPPFILKSYTLNERLYNKDLSITNDDPRLKYIFIASKNHNGMKMSFRADMLYQENIKGFYVLLALLSPLLLSLSLKD